MRCLLFPTAVTQSAFADIAVSPVCTIFFTLIAELVARTLPACASAPGRLTSDISKKANMSADASAAGECWLIHEIIRLRAIPASLFTRYASNLLGRNGLYKGIFQVEKMHMCLKTSSASSLSKSASVVGHACRVTYYLPWCLFSPWSDPCRFLLDR